MKRLICVMLICLFVSPVIPLRAQGDETCDPIQVKEWLNGWQAWVNATGDVANTNLPGEQAVRYFVDHFSEISSLPRPACVTNVMHSTAYWYSALIMLTRCAQDNQTECAAALGPLVSTYGAQMNSRAVDLASTVGFKFESSARPEGWSLGTSQTLEPSPQAATTSREPLFNVIVNGNVNVRDCGSTSCKVVGQATNGQVLAVVGQDGEWYEVEWGNSTAYIASWLTTRGPDIVVDLYEGYLDLETGCFLALRTRRGSSDLGVAISGEQRDEVIVDIYRPGETSPVKVSAQYDKTFVDSNEPYVHQTYYWGTWWPTGVYQIELRLAGKSSMIGFSVPESGDHIIYVMCD